VDGYLQQHGLDELARRYAANLANGRFLWRNRIGAEQVQVHVAQLCDGKAERQWQFDALAHPLNDLAAQVTEVAELAGVITAGLAGSKHVLLQVTAFVRVGEGQEVFPSQELILDRDRGDKSKTLYHVDGAAAIHSQKIGNALRTIDTWYEGAAENGPIAVEPYGSVTTQGKAWRQPRKNDDFYSLLDGWVISDKVPPVEQQHFVIATLIRGGVFGKAE
jgi:CRISPR-associated protein Csy3